MKYLEWMASPILGVSSAFSYLHAEYGTAVICGICAGLVLGVQLGVTIERRL